jgi:hypothetical protein
MISGTFNFMIVFQAEHKNIVLIKSGELLESSVNFFNFLYKILFSFIGEEKEKRVAKRLFVFPFRTTLFCEGGF